MIPSSHRSGLRPDPCPVPLLAVLFIAGSITLATGLLAPAPARGQTLEPVGAGPIALLPLRLEDGEYIDPYLAAFAPADDNGYFGLWFEVGFEELGPGHLMGQRFDGFDLPIETPRTISRTPAGQIQRSLQLRRKGDRMLAVWHRHGATSPNLFGRFLDAQGRPLSPVFPIGDADSTSRPALVLLESGRALVVWVDAGGATGRLVGRAFEPNGAVGPKITLTTHEARRPALGVDSRERILLVWHEAGRNVPPYFDVFGRWLDTAGRATSSPFLVAPRSSTTPSLAMWPDGRSAVAWSACSGSVPLSDCRVRIRLLDDEGSPITGSVRLSPDDGASHVRPVTAIGADGTLFVNWQACPAIPGGFYRDCHLYAVAFDQDGEMLSTAPAVAFTGEPERRYAVALDDDFLVYWYGYNGRPDGDYILRYRLVPPPPPAGVAPLASAEVPGFRFWVRIGDDANALRGAMEPECIPETLCVSGAIPGRPELFLRVVGPRPNGYLWPTIVKFTTSRVEIWIEQISTGTVRYYELEGARPGSSELPGLFDRRGFQP